MSNPDKTRFQDSKSDEYALIREVMPHFDALQDYVATLCDHHEGAVGKNTIAMEIGCGDGLTTTAILCAAPALRLTSIDPEPKMISRASEHLREFIAAGRCELLQTDALSYLQGIPDHTFDIIASALTLHNLKVDARHEIHRHIFRTLKPGGLFLNADKYAPQDDQARFAALEIALSRFFDTLVPLGKHQLLQDWVVHNVWDQAPDRCMKEGDTIEELSALGFIAITIHARENMEAVLSARKPA